MIKPKKHKFEQKFENLDDEDFYEDMQDSNISVAM